MKVYPLIVLCCLLPMHLFAQLLTGKITDVSGEAIPNATLYIREVALGITADDNGEFQASLKKGSYTCDFSSLGYERKTLPLTIDKAETHLAVAMEKKVYALKEVIISANREDPAYAIMRKAIGMAPFYLHQIEKYESSIYVKGSVKVEKIPRLMTFGSNGKKLKNLTNKLFLIESQNEVSFTSPNHYEQKVLAFSSTLPADIDAGQVMSVMTANIYDPNAFGRISPLAPGAFSYYKFALEGISMEGEHMINKIRVQPKKNNPKLVSGWLYIIENSWNVQSADLSATELGVTIRFTATYNEVKPSAFLPTAYDIDMKVDAMGVKATGKYYSSVQYKTVELSGATQTVRQKSQEQLNTLAAKEELSNREAYKMAKLMKETTEPEETKKERESLEINPGNANIKVTVDTLAGTRDSTYWETIRKQPLKKDEIVSYQVRDSLKTKMETLRSKDSLQNRTPAYWIGKLITGESFPLNKKVQFGYSGLLKACPQYNFVDGFWLGQQFTLRTSFTESRVLTVSPSLYYTTAGKSINWQIDGSYQYAPMRRGNVSLSGGQTTADYNGESGTLLAINSIASLFFGENPVKFYKKKFVALSNTVELANGLPLTTGISYEKRNALHNRQSYNFFGNTPSSNLPNGQLMPMPDNSAMKVKIRLAYTPQYHYWKHRGKKMYIYSDYPTFSIQYEAGISTGSQESASFNKLEGNISQTIKISEFDRIGYTVNGGKFLSDKRVYFPDFKHFDTNELFITGSSLDNSFCLFDNYIYSTDKQWLQAHLNYTSDYLLFKRLPFLQKYMFNEALHARTLWIPGKSYSEFGYSVGFSNIARIGVFVGLEKGKYDAVGFTISLPVLKSMGIK
ncbi:DUF5686 family protein [Parabacteroides chongii]|uniref:DUF5686 family protein n=1 Tax=Parabacteroides chongii TaxID=2685834 RepID=UPI00240DB3CC|nr:DUF5686 family protein [Parabacteroides chongii]WFE85579.1 DUF5686 family protein [Parabacteroides chongii]